MTRSQPPASLPRTVARVLLGLGLVYAGAGHLTFARTAFQAQVPSWATFGTVDADFVVRASGVVEMVLGAALVLLVSHRELVGWVAAAFFVAVFPGNLSQYVTGTDAFGLDTDAERLARLFFQPVLVVWALWSSGAWSAWRQRRVRGSGPDGG